MFGVPKEFVSDNGPQYSSKEFKQFTDEWGIKHNPSSPLFPKSNGLAERNIQTIKNLIKKCTETGNDISEALLHLRATPIDSHTKSPAELMFKRQLVTMLPSRSEPSLENIETRNHLFGRLQEKNGKEIPGLLQGQQIRVREPMTKTWIPGAIMQRSTQPRSYIVSTEKGQILRRNRQHIRSVPPQPMTPAARSVPPQPMTPAAHDTASPQQINPTSPTTPYTTRSGRIVRPNKKYK